MKHNHAYNSPVEADAANDDAFVPASTYGGVDYCSREGAHALKARIERYWAERGYDVMVVLENVGFHAAIRAARYDLRSDLVDGWPRTAMRRR